MRAILGCGVAAILMFTAASTAEDKKDEKFDAKKLLGKWEPGDSKKDFKTVVEFAKEGKLNLYITVMDKTEKIEGTYKLDGNKMSLALSFGGEEKKDTITILKLTDDEMATEDSKGKKETFKRIKDKK